MKTSDAERLLKSELATVTGCTEPAAIAHAVQEARRRLSSPPSHGRVRVALSLSPEVLRNASTAVVPAIGRRGVKAAVVGGLLSSARGFDPFSGLKVPPRHPLLYPRSWLSVSRSRRGGIYIRATVEVPGESVTATVSGRHDNVVAIARNGRVVHRAARRPLPRLKGLEEIASIVARRSRRLEKIAGDFAGGQVRADPRKSLADGVAELVAKRMAGHPLPVVTITGSGNQGIFLGIPLRALRRAFGRRALPALLFSLLAQIYLSQRRGRISGACGLATKAAPALAAGLAWAQREDIPSLRRSMADVSRRLARMPCRGAKPDCGAKASRALRCALSLSAGRGGGRRKGSGAHQRKSGRTRV